MSYGKRFGRSGGMRKHRISGHTQKPQHLKQVINIEKNRDEDQIRALKKSQKQPIFSSIKELFKK